MESTRRKNRNLEMTCMYQLSFIDILSSLHFYFRRKLYGL